MTESMGWMLAVVGGVAAIAWLVRSGRLGGGDFVIRLGPGDRVEVTGKVPRSKVPGIAGFFRDQAGGVPRGRIVGTFGPGGTPRLWFSPTIGPALRQRARNFLIEHLR
ncbi:hypothetical protein [Tautonia rosea]|uniref:hypothetical protein n=1 Tax=Tautonia rosea TaxID=2728037 RepID=UPI001475F2B3|nr:hypothetical protein [Tautonia rosea]